MLITKTKSSKQNSNKKTSEKYSKELIEQVYKMAYAMLKWNYKNKNVTNDEIMDIAVYESVKYITNSNTYGITQKPYSYKLYKTIKTQLTD